VYPTVNAARIRKTQLFWNNRAEFMRLLFKDLDALGRKAARLNVKAVVRLNGTTDLPWEYIKVGGKNVFEHYPAIQFYDYTASIARVERLARTPIANYHLTFSRKENNHVDAIKALKLGFNVSIVMHPDQIWPKILDGFKVISGDDTDLRFLDARTSADLGAWVALTPKGALKRSDSPFMYRAA
jgi:hypothetical protein